jgi:hypothetical protein
MGHHLVPLQKNNFAILIIVDPHAGWIPELWRRLHPKLEHHPTVRLYNMYIFSANLRIYGLYEIIWIKWDYMGFSSANLRYPARNDKFLAGERR